MRGVLPGCKSTCVRNRGATPPRPAAASSPSTVSIGMLTVRDTARPCVSPFPAPDLLFCPMLGEWVGVHPRDVVADDCGVRVCLCVVYIGRHTFVMLRITRHLIHPSPRTPLAPNATVCAAHHTTHHIHMHSAEFAAVLGVHDSVLVVCELV